MINVPGLQPVACKLQAHLGNHLPNPICGQILLGYQSEELALVLSPYLLDPTVVERVAFVDAVEKVEGFLATKLDMVRFDDLFQKVFLAGDK